jgi:hypothetical protein
MGFPTRLGTLDSASDDVDYINMTLRKLHLKQSAAPLPRHFPRVKRRNLGPQ